MLNTKHEKFSSTKHLMHVKIEETFMVVFMRTIREDFVEK